MSESCLIFWGFGGVLEKFRGLYLALILTLAVGGPIGCNADLPEKSVSGIIRLSSSRPFKAPKTRTLFIVLVPEGGGPPLAVQRLVRVKFPYRYILTKDDVMFRGKSFSGKVRVRARLDADGRAGPLVRGDFEGIRQGFVSIGARDVDILIDTAGTAAPLKVADKAKPRKKQPPAAISQVPPPPDNGPKISGTIEVAPRLAKKASRIPVLYIVARTEKPGPPLAVVRVPNPRFPLPFIISNRNIMMQGGRLEGRVRITARLDADGNADPPRPGDMEGSASDLVAVGASGVRITVDREF